MVSWRVTAGSSSGAEARPVSIAGQLEEARTPFELPQPMRGRFTGAFLGGDLEDVYRGQELKPHLERSMWRIVVVVTLFLAAQQLIRMVSRSPPYGFAVWLPFVNLAGSLITLCVIVCAKRLNWPLRVLELWTTFYLTVMFVILQLTDRVDQYLQCNGDLAAAPALVDVASCIDDGTSAALKYCGLLTLVSIFTPLRPPLFTCIAAFGFVTVVLVEFLILRAPMSEKVIHIILYGLITYFLTEGRSRMMRIERTQWYFHREVDAAVARMHVAERARASQELKLASASSATVARSRLIRVAMHDLRSPLLSMLNLASTMSKLPHTTTLGHAGVQEAIATLRQCATLMEHIVSDMLDFERIDSGRLNLVLDSFRTDQLLSSAKATFDGLCTAKSVRLVIEPLPEALAGERGTFVGDVRRLQQCLNNGVSNALKFTERGGHITIRVVAGAHEDAAAGWARLHVLVIDDGSGLSSEELETLTRGEAFSQVGRGQLQGSGGTGLGLGITRQILQLHNGSELRLESDGPGTGVTFEMVVNVRAPPRARPAEARSETAGPAEAQPPAQQAERALAASGLACSSRARGGTAETDATTVDVDASDDDDADDPSGAAHPRASMASVTSEAPRSLPPSTEFRRFTRKGSMGGYQGDRTHAKALSAGWQPDVAALRSLAAHHDEQPLEHDAADEVERFDDGRSSRVAAPFAPAVRARHAPPGRASSAHVPHALPLPPLPGEPDHAHPPGPAAPAAPAAEPFCVLHVEDDPFLQITLPLRVFEELSCAYEQAVNGQEAVVKVLKREVPYGAILIDNQMPVMSGCEATKQMRAAGYTGTIIGMTGDPAGSDDRNAFEAAGLDLCVDKSTDGVEAVIKVIRGAMDKAAAGGANGGSAAAAAPAPRKNPLL